MLSKLSSFVLLSQAAAPGDPAEPFYQRTFGVFAILIAVIALCMWLGVRISKSLKMRDYGWRIAVIFIAISIGLIAVATGKFRRGYDLAGGISLIYEIDQDPENEVDGDDKNLMKKLINAISPRIDPAGVMQVTIRQYGTEQVEIIIPEVNDEEAAQIKRRIYTAGNLEFRIVADTTMDAEEVKLAESSERISIKDEIVNAYDNDPDRQYIIDLAKATKGTRVLDGDIQRAEWLPVKADERAAVEKDERENDLVVRREGDSLEKLQFVGRERGRWVKVGIVPEESREKNEGKFRFTPAGHHVSRASSDGGLEVLCVIDEQNVTGGFLKSARAGFDQNGNISVDFRFRTQGAKRFGELTRRIVSEDQKSSRKHHLAIILDGELLSAPTLNSVITDAGQITGNFSKEEVDWLVGVLNAGSLPARLNKIPISERKISPTLGQQTIDAGTFAIYVSLGGVLLFMPFYYRFSGVVACFALLLNLLLVLGVMIMVRAAFTLPGLAGLVLTVGMAVDANVLIFERIREELDRGAALRMAIRNGFSRATRTIVDANLTTLITGIVLYAVGNDQIKGFAVTLILGIGMSMFTAIFCSRVIFDVAEKKRWISKLGMTRILGKTSIDFLGKRFVAGTASVLLIGLGVFGVNYRGEDLLDIDLRGGVRIEVVFNDATTDRVVYEALENNEDLQDLQVIGSSKDSKSFFVETTQDELAKVEDAVKEAFGDKLKTNSLSYDAAAIMPIADSAATVESDTSDPAAPPAEEGPAKSPPEDAGGQPDEKPADEKPADEKPAAEDPPTPGENDGARADLPSRSLIALAQPDSEDSAVETDAEPAAVAEPAPADGSPPPTAVEGDSPPEAAEPPSEAEDADVPQTGNESPAEKPAAQPIDTAAAPSAPATRFAGGCEVPLVFADEISQGTLIAKLTDVIAANNQIKTPDMEVTNREVKPDSNSRKHEWTLRSTMTMGQTKDVLDQLQSQLAVEPHFPTAETIGTQVAGDTQTQGLAAIIASLVFIVTYIWIRFQQVSYGLAAVVALVHDVLITLGLIALSTFVANISGVSNVLQLESFKISLPMLAAFLTIIGYSLNDTIVVFDRIREVKGKSPRLTPDMVNTSINQTLSRTLLTSLTTLIVVLILYFVGGPGIHGFAFALVIGVLVGTYSSIFVASPALLWMRRFGAGAKNPLSAARSEATAVG
ncbi:MAG: protein translocase subunit SecD [Pirellulales bacterium]